MLDEVLRSCRAWFCQVTFVVELFKNSISRLATLSKLERNVGARDTYSIENLTFKSLIDLWMKMA